MDTAFAFPASPCFAMQKLRVGKEGRNILLGMGSALPCSESCCGAGQGGAGTEGEQVGAEGPYCISADQ